MKTNFDVVKDKSVIIEGIGEPHKKFSTVKDFIDFINLPLSILDEDEKRYIKNIVRPFRNKVKCITKHTLYNYGLEFLTLEYYERSVQSDSETNINTLYFPYFPMNTMYENMESYKDYTLEELGIKF